MKILIIYDDTGKKSEAIRDIIGEKGFGDVVVKKHYLEETCRSVMKKQFSDMIWMKVSLPSSYADILKKTERYEMEEVRIIHFFSNYIISDEKTVSLSLRKLKLIEEPFGVLMKKRSVAAMFPTLHGYRSFLKSIMAGGHAWDIARNMTESFEIEGVVDIGETTNFIRCITGNFDSRYFNSLKEDTYTVTKQSTNKRKIRAEYMFYQLIPEDMRHWFVQPYDYQEGELSSSYRMERLYMTDLAIKWVHGSMDVPEFSNLMNRYFYFFSCRHERPCSQDSFVKQRDVLYVDKVKNRIAELKNLPQYQGIGRMLSASGEDLDSYVARYLSLKSKLEKNTRCTQVIGHGDPCFANALYNKSTQTLKFIDPKGALEEKELWTDPYYDVAKLSHSVCGRYDFFNNALYEISLSEDLSYSLSIPFDNRKFIEVFKEIVTVNGFDYRLVRLYEASLFLSMLPLHIDNPHKVFGFILNARDILKELEQNV